VAAIRVADVRGDPGGAVQRTAPQGSTPDPTAQTWGPFSSIFSRYLELLSWKRKRPGRKANHSPSSKAYVKTELNCTSTPGMPSCRVHGNNKVNFNPEQDMKGQRGSRGIIILFL